MTAPSQEAATAVEVVEVGPEAAGEVLGIVRAAFAERPPLDPPSTALEETTASVAAGLRVYGGLLARLDGQPAGALLFAAGPTADALILRRVAVLPSAQARGVAQRLVRAAQDVALARGARSLHLTARAELPATVRLWVGAGFGEVSRDGTRLHLAKELPVALDVPSPEAMRDLGQQLAIVLAPGDLVILTGDLGAGKTTFVRGLGAGLGVRGEVTSPTFVLARVHPSLRGGPALVHVDAYRLGGRLELDDLDLDVSLEDSVTVVEWGEGLAEALAEERIEVSITRPHGGSVGEGRRVRLAPVGARWVGSGLAAALA